jgi:hypothetical protein
MGDALKDARASMLSAQLGDPRDTSARNLTGAQRALSGRVNETRRTHLGSLLYGSFVGSEVL